MFPTLLRLLQQVQYRSRGFVHPFGATAETIAKKERCQALNIICDKTLLSAAIDGVSKAVTLRSTIPVLEGILLKAEVSS